MKRATLVNILLNIIVFSIILIVGFFVVSTLLSEIEKDPTSPRMLIAYDNFLTFDFLIGFILSIIAGYLFAVSLGCIINPAGVLLSIALLFLSFHISNSLLIVLSFFISFIVSAYKYKPCFGGA